MEGLADAYLSKVVKEATSHMHVIYSWRKRKRIPDQHFARGYRFAKERKPDVTFEMMEEAMKDLVLGNET